MVHASGVRCIDAGACSLTVKTPAGLQLQACGCAVHRQPCPPVDAGTMPQGAGASRADPSVEAAGGSGAQQAGESSQVCHQSVVAIKSKHVPESGRFKPPLKTSSRFGKLAENEGCAAPGCQSVFCGDMA